MSTLHATCIAFGRHGVLIRGASGAGKSTLAHIALIRGPFYGVETSLVADDRVVVSTENDALIARPPETIRGLLEIRGLGIVQFPHRDRVVIDRVLDLLPVEHIPRLPSKDESTVVIQGVTLPRLMACTPERGLDVLLTTKDQSDMSSSLDWPLSW